MISILEPIKQSKWSSGTTTELFIFPPHATLEKRDFLFRISSAIISQEESEFSLFKGYNRLLMILDGKLEISHSGKSGTQLIPYDNYAFDGAWQTKGIGKVTDFNVIYSKSLMAQMAYFSGIKGDLRLLPATDKWNFLYMLSGSGILSSNGTQYAFHQGSLVMYDPLETNLFSETEVSYINIGISYA